MEHPPTPEDARAPGLKLRRGGKTAYWCASLPKYHPRTVNLSSLPPAERPARCRQLQAEMLAWAARPTRDERFAFDGTLGSVMDAYLNDPKSSYTKLKQSSRHPYTVYATKLRAGYGTRRVKAITGRDVIDWYDVWKKPPAAGAPEQRARANMTVAVLKAALSHATLCGYEGCAGLLAMLREAAFEKTAPRDQAPDAANVIAARAAAHALGHPHAALAYALQFETTARQWDIVGEWFPQSDPRLSTVAHGRTKWFGPLWSSIEGTILTIKPTKTEGTTRAVMAIDLALCPMVMEEIARIPPDRRIGPLIVHPITGRPYQNAAFRNLWRRVREKAELDPKLWNRDLRAGGNTEGQRAGATAEDRAKMAAHSKRINETVYSRDVHAEVLTATSRVLAARIAHRTKTKPE